MKKPRVLVTRLIPEKGLEIVRKAAEVEVWPDPLPPPYEILVKKAQGMDALLCLLTDKIDADSDLHGHDRTSFAELASQSQHRFRVQL
jgi:glyoxylate reductase